MSIQPTYNRVLYVDPDEHLSRVFQDAMTRAGFEVEVAGSGEEGLIRCNENAYDVVVVDYKLPGCDGLEVIRRLAVQGPEPVTVMLTADGDETVAVEALKLGASDYLIKDADGYYLQLFPAVMQRLRQHHLLGEAKQLVEENQRALIQGLRSVALVADQLISCPDMDSLFRKTIELAHEQLELERCSLYVADDTGEYVHGTFGINRREELVDERAFRTPMTDEWRGLLRPNRRTADSPWTVLYRPYTEWDGARFVTFGEGWIACTPIYSVSGLAGVMFNDTAITRTPLDDTRQEMIVVFSSILGNLIERKRAEAAIQRANDDLERRVQERTRALIKINHERQTLSRRLMEVQETERRGIARELHDEIGQALTAVKMNLQAIQRFAPASQIDDSMRIIDQTLSQIRDISLNLRPSILDDLGLVPALRWYADRQAKRAGLAVHFAADVTAALPDELESTCFRVV